MFKRFIEVGIMKTYEIYQLDEKEKVKQTNGSFLPQKEAQKGQHVVCEPSIREKDENEESSSVDYEGKIDFNVKSQEILEGSVEDIVLDKGKTNINKNKAYSFSCRKIVKESNGIHIYKTVQTEIDEDFEKENIRIDNIDKQLFKKRTSGKKQEEGGSTSHQDQTADVSCNIPLQTGLFFFLI